MNFFAVSNYVEAGLWIVIAKVNAFRYRAWRWRWMAAVVLVAFGVSDVVEVQTGAWWRPWWLLVWKGLCVIAMLLMFLATRRERAGKGSGDPR